MNVDKKINKFNKRYKKAKVGDTVKVIELKRKHFKKVLSTPHGFGFQDLKDDAKDFYRLLICNDVDITISPNGLGTKDFGVLITTVKN